MAAHGRLLTGVLAAVSMASMAGAQAVEEHPAPILHGAGTARLDAGALLKGSQDATPFGVTLQGLMVVDANIGGAARAKSGPGIDTSAAGATAQGPDFAAKLRGFLGQPLSYKVIADIQAAITQYYREHGRSLVLVSVPPQEITTGVLQVNVNTFRLEEPPVLAGDASDGPYVQRQIRLAPGQEVDTARLMDDVSWLNLNPFRRVSVAFEPGKTENGTKLTVQVQSKRPWSAYAGASNAGSKDTGEARVFAGFNISALPWQDQQLAYQVNASPSSGGLWDTEGTKGYVSHSLSYFVPVTLPSGLRFKATAGLTHVSSFAEPDAVFSTDTTTDGQTFELAFPLPRRSGTWSLMPEIYLGLSHETYSRRQYFGGVIFVAPEETRLTHLDLGLRSSLNGRLFGRPTHGDFDIGYVTGRQETNGATSDYGFLHASLSQELGLEGNRSLAFRLAGQKASGALHPLEQLGLGGEATVRGYGANAASGDSGASMSLEYRLAPIELPLGDRRGELRPAVFADWGMTDGTGGTEHLASLGLGATFTMGEELEAAVTLAQALQDAGGVEAGDVSVALRLVARF